MSSLVNAQNGTDEDLNCEIALDSAANSSSKFNVTVYMSERDKYKAEFNAWSKKTAQSTLEMGLWFRFLCSQIESPRFCSNSSILI